MPSRNGIRHTDPPDPVQSLTCGAHAAPPTLLRALGSRYVGQVVGREFDAASFAHTLVKVILFLSPCPMMHADWRSTYPLCKRFK